MNITNKSFRFFNRIAIFLSAFFGLLMLNFGIDNFIYNQTYFIKFDYIKVFAFIIMITALLSLLTWYVVNFEKSRRKTIILAIFLVVGQCFIIVFCFRKIGWDCGTVLDLANQLATVHKVNWSFYLAEYPNNALLVIFFRDVFCITNKIGLSNWLIAVGVNICCINLAIFLIYKLSKRICNEVVARIALVISVFVLGFSLWLAVPYTDTLSLPFPILILYLYLIMCDSIGMKKNVVAFCLGMIIFLSYMLKPTNIIVLIAILFIELASWISHVNRYEAIKKSILPIILIILGFVFVSFTFSIHKNHVYKNIVTKEDEYNNSVDMLHYFKMGLNQPYGEFSSKDVDKIGTIIGKDKKEVYNKRIIKKRLEALGPINYVKFLYRKGSFIYTDGTFYYGGEGGFYQSDTFFHQKGIPDCLRQLRDIEKPLYKAWTINLSEAIWIILLFLMAIGSFLSNKKWILEKEILILRTSILGITAFLLLFEARSRYLINHLPIMIILVSVCCVECYYKVIKYRASKGENKVKQNK